MRKLTPTNLSDSIEKFIEDNNLTNESFAKNAGISRRTLQYILKGKSGNHNTIFKILEYMDYDIFYSKRD